MSLLFAFNLRVCVYGDLTSLFNVCRANLKYFGGMVSGLCTCGVAFAQFIFFWGGWMLLELRCLIVVMIQNRAGVGSVPKEVHRWWEVCSRHTCDVDDGRHWVCFKS